MRCIYSSHIIQVFSFVCVLTWSLLGVKKARATPRSVSFRGLIQNFRRASPSLSYAESPPPGGTCAIKVVEKLTIYSPSCQQPKLEVFTIDSLL